MQRGAWVAHLSPHTENSVTPRFDLEAAALLVSQKGAGFRSNSYLPCLEDIPRFLSSLHASPNQPGVPRQRTSFKSNLAPRSTRSPTTQDITTVLAATRQPLLTREATREVCGAIGSHVDQMFLIGVS